MRNFKVYVDGELFHHPHISKLSITEAQISEDAENIDSLKLSAPFNHPYITSIRPMSSVIVCKKGNDVVFEGRALDEGTDFYNTHSWTCESALAYLKDTMQPPFSYTGTLRGLLEQFVGVHNSNVEEQKRFTVGNVTVVDNNDYVAYSSIDYLSTMEAIKTRLIDTHGGYLRVRYEGNTKYLDYLSDYNTYSLQTVEFGKNITDVKINKDHTERITAFIPLGAKIKVEDQEGNEVETDERVDITSVNGGLNYIYDEDAVDEIGWIWASEIWDDVTLPGNLLTKAEARLADLVRGLTSIQLTIIDESNAGVDIGDIRARMYVRCISKPHGIDGTYLCMNRTIDYINPAGNTITIGASGVSLTKTSVKQDINLVAIEDKITGQNSKIEEMSNTVDSVSNDTETLKIQVHECYAEITNTSNEIMSSVMDTYVEKTDLEQLQQDFQSSITQSSSEIRIDFTAITDEIRESVAINQELLEEYIRFKGALIELGKVGNAFTAELSNEELAFKENDIKIAYISNNNMVITDAEIRNKISLGNESRGWFDFIPRVNGNLSIKWRDPRG